MSSAEPRRARGQWPRGRTFLFMIILVVAAAVAYYADGWFALGVVIIVGLLIISYFGSHRFANWQTGRPSRTSRQLAERPFTTREQDGQPLRADPDAVEDWLRERSLDRVFDDSDEA